MDFKRIQIIFLITFVIIDIFLFSLFHQNQSVQNDSASSSDTSIISDMHNDQISFQRSPSGRKRTGYYISAKKTNGVHKRLRALEGQDVHYDNYHLDSTFKRPIALNTAHPHTTIDRLLHKPSMIAYGDRYHYCSDLSDPDTLVYVQRTHNNGAYNEFFSDTAEIKFHVVNHLLNGYSQSYVNNIKNLREKSDTISAKRALTLLYQYNNIPNNTRIEWCHFAYTHLLSVKGNYVYIPTWVIAMKESGSDSVQYRDVNAFSGSIINTSSSSSDQ